MKKAKRLAIIVCAIAMLMSILAIPASAATQDHYHTFSWEGTTRHVAQVLITTRLLHMEERQLSITNMRKI